jgi:hypothetical protein
MQTIDEQEQLLGRGHPTLWRARPGSNASVERLMVVAYGPPDPGTSGSVFFVELIDGQSHGLVQSARWEDFFEQYKPRG